MDHVNYLINRYNILYIYIIICCIIYNVYYIIYVYIYIFFMYIYIILL